MNIPSQLQQFANRFEKFTDCYVLIGGIATVYHTEKRLGKARKTEDLDIVVLDLDSKLSKEFLNELKSYLQEMGYKNYSKSDDKNQNYRFSDPVSQLAPRVLELFSGKFDWTPTGNAVQKIQDDELSTIVMNGEYYDLVKSQSTTESITELGSAKVRVASPAAVILLKAKAFINLRTSSAKQSNKHLKDIIRLARVLVDSDRVLTTKTLFEPLETMINEADSLFNPSRVQECGWPRKTESIEVVTRIKEIINT